MSVAVSEGTVVIDRLMAAVTRIREGKDPRVQPGQDVRISDAASDYDSVRQGDLYIVVLGKPLENVEMELIEPRLDQNHHQLVPGNNVGAKHCLRGEDLVGLKMYRPKVWNDDIFIGPYIMHPSKDIVIEHLTHGNVTVPAGMGVHCVYQREFDRVQQIEQRARD